MPDESKLSYCYNKGCAQKFNPEQNDEKSCKFHPGPAFFHEGYKIWKCCDRKSTDFTTWLSYPGCAVGKHDSTPPPESEKPLKSSECADNDGGIETFESPKPTGTKPPAAADRTEYANEAFQDLKIICPDSLREQIAAKIAEKSQEQTVEDLDSLPVSVGTQCKNNGCKQYYDGPDSNEQQCFYHTGVPIFHEGCKFWSCCRKKTSDFDAFLEQEGCTGGSHVWREKAGAKKWAHRHEWYQAGNGLVLTLYAKGIMPDESKLSMNSVHIFGQILIGYGEDTAGDVSSCVVKMTASKLEIKFNKLEPFTWPRLTVEQTTDS